MYTCCLRLTFSVFFPPTSHRSLMAFPLVCFTVLQKSRTLLPWGHLSYEKAAVDDDECFNQLAYCSEQVVEPWGTVACERQWHITWMITPAGTTRTPWLCAASCWGLLSEKGEDHWLEIKPRTIWKHQIFITAHNNIILSLKSRKFYALFVFWWMESPDDSWAVIWFVPVPSLPNWSISTTTWHICHQSLFSQCWFPEDLILLVWWSHDINMRWNISKAFVITKR